MTSADILSRVPSRLRRDFIRLAETGELTEALKVEIESDKNIQDACEVAADRQMRGIEIMSLWRVASKDNLTTTGGHPAVRPPEG